MPRVGAPARIVHFGGDQVSVVVTRVAENGRLVEVRTADGELHEFRLSPATARFVPPGRPQGERLELLG
jgi:hypothetical protein